MEICVIHVFIKCLKFQELEDYEFISRTVIFRRGNKLCWIGLTVIPCGPIPPNPSELIASKRMKELVANLRQQYDVVIIDAAPVGVVTDSAIFSTIVDGTLLVIASGKTEIDGGKRAKQLLENVNARILGVVMTMIPVTKKGYYGYQYYSYEEERNHQERNVVYFQKHK